jgi:DNA mismatch endonuclease, patch repair protein
MLCDFGPSPSFADTILLDISAIISRGGDTGMGTSEKRRAMQAQRQRNTRPETDIRRALFALGLRYRIHQPVVPGTRRTVDVVFSGARVAVDVRGCFWHGCPRHATAPKTNADWWAAKLRKNKVRDADTAERLLTAGWALVVVWECDDPIEAAARIAALIRRRKASRFEPVVLQILP